MARENQNKVSKKEISKRSKKQEEIRKNKKMVENSDSDSNSDDVSEVSDSENDDFNVHEYRKFISKIFP